MTSDTEIPLCEDPLNSLANVVLLARPKQSVFSEDESEFLRGFLDEYVVSIDKKPAIKGSKRQWVKANVYSKYIVKFNSARDGGPNLESLFTVWFLCECD